MKTRPDSPDSSGDILHIRGVLHQAGLLVVNANASPGAQPRLNKSIVLSVTADPGTKQSDPAAEFLTLDNQDRLAPSEDHPSLRPS